MNFESFSIGIVRYTHKLNSTMPCIWLYKKKKKKGSKPSHNFCQCDTPLTHTPTHTAELYTTRAIIIPNTYQHYIYTYIYVLTSAWLVDGKNSYNYAPQYSHKRFPCLVYWPYEFSLKILEPYSVGARFMNVFHK